MTDGRMEGWTDGRMEGWTVEGRLYLFLAPLNLATLREAPPGLAAARPPESPCVEDAFGLQ